MTNVLWRLVPRDGGTTMTKPMTNDQGPAAVTGDQASDLLLHA